MFGKRNFFFFFLHIIVSNILVLNLLAHPDTVITVKEEITPSHCYYKRNFNEAQA